MVLISRPSEWKPFSPPGYRVFSPYSRFPRYGRTFLLIMNCSMQMMLVGQQFQPSIDLVLYEIVLDIYITIEKLIRYRDRNLEFLTCIHHQVSRTSSLPHPTSRRKYLFAGFAKFVDFLVPSPVSEIVDPKYAQAAVF